MAEPLICSTCGRRFTLSDELRARYPGWRPEHCRECYAASFGTRTPDAARDARRQGGPIEENLTVDEVLARHTRGPSTGVFTDGSANPNPGPGGWGAVYVVDGEVVARDHGHESHTTNNRMELTALIRGCDLVPEGTPATVYTDSRLCVNTITQWAPGWERRGWKRKTGEISNLDLVKQLYGRFTTRPELSIEWVPAHAGYRWNEYADSLATAYTRDRV
jgi:ribonuclease HI